MRAAAVIVVAAFACARSDVPASEGAPASGSVLWAEEDDAAADVDWSKKVQGIETFSTAFHTAEGVRPGSLVTDVEWIFGRTREIRLSEIESRQYIEFDGQPDYLTLRLDYTGVFRDGNRRSSEFSPGAKIFSIAVSATRLSATP